MKKGLAIFVTVGLLCLTGCGSKEEKIMSCKKTADQAGLKMDLSYKVTYKGNDVTNVESTEKVTSEDNAILEAYKEQVEKLYSSYADVEHYDYNVTIDGNTLTSKTDIDYSKIDTDKMIEIDSANGALIKDGKININDIKSYYEALGVTCEK